VRRGGSLRDLLSLGGRVPPAVGGLVAGYVLLSLVARLGGLAGALALAPAAVLEGEAWRLLTWSLVDGQPINVIFGGLMLYWFGRDLCAAWGERRFLVTWLALSGASGLLSVVLAALAPGLFASVWLGAWPVLSALTLAWGLLFPERRILFNFVVPVSGRALALLTVGTTVFFALFEGFRAYLPHFAAQGLFWLYYRGLSPRGAWQSVRLWLGQRRQRRRAKHLTVVKKNGKGEPPQWMN
jgi:membrane associated rhomboid family serine protease